MKEMSNALKDVQLLEKDLMRDLTNEEIAAVINKGWEKFLAEDLKMDTDDFNALQKMREIISAFCTKNQDDYEESLEGDITTAYLALKTIVNDMEEILNICHTNEHPCGVTDKGPEAPYKSEEKECSRKDFKPCSIKSCSGEEAGGDYDLDKAVEDIEASNCGWTAFVLCAVFDMLPARDSKWLREYIKMDPDYTELVELAREHAIGKNKDEINFDALCDDVSDHIKDTVIKGIADKLLANKGKAIVLDTEILDEVFDYLLNTNQNIKVRAVNNQITVL